MINQQEGLGCGATGTTANATCLCNNAGFAYGLRDCSNEACGADVASSVLAYGVSYCSCEYNQTPRHTHSASNFEY